jgi:hypothetical protein
VTALGTDSVRGDSLTTLGTVGQLLGMLLIVGPTAAGFLVRLSSLRDGHDKSCNPWLTVAQPMLRAAN